MASDRTAASRQTLGTAVVLVVLLAAYALVAGHFVIHGRINEDEGWYLYAANLVYGGRALYRDFAFFQMPLLPYLYGLPQLLAHGLLAGRLTSFVLGLVTVGLGLRLTWERGGRLAATVFAAGMLLTPPVLWTLTTTRTEPLSALLLMLVAFLLLRRRPSETTDATALAVAVLATATRISSALIPVAVMICLLARRRRARRTVATLLPAAVVACLIAVPLLRDPSAAWFDIVTVQSHRHAQLGPAPAWSAGKLLWLKWTNVRSLQDFYGMTPFLGLLIVATSAIHRLRRQASPQILAPAAGLIVLGAAYYLPNLAPRAVFPEYFAPAFPLFLVAFSWIAGTLWRDTRSWRRVVLALALLVLLTLQIKVFVTRVGWYVKPGESNLEQVDRVAAYIRTIVPPGKRLWTLDTYVAVASDRAVAPGLEMSLFSYSPRLGDDEGRRYHVLTPGLLDHSLTDPAVGAVVVSDMDLGILVKRQYGVGYRPRQRLSEADIQAALPALAGHRLTRVFEHFGQFDDNLYVLVPAPQ